MRLLLALCSAVDDASQPDNDAVRRSFASAVVSTRALGALLQSAAAGVDQAVSVAAIGMLLDFLGDAHAGVVLENLTAVPDGELKDILRACARSSAGYEGQIGALLAQAPPDLGVELSPSAAADEDIGRARGAGAGARERARRGAAGCGRRAGRRSALRCGGAR